MSKFYNDYHGRARFDPTPDNREFKKDCMHKALRLVFNEAEKDQINALIVARENNADVREPLRVLAIVEGLRQKLERMSA